MDILEFVFLSRLTSNCRVGNIYRDFEKVNQRDTWRLMVNASHVRDLPVQRCAWLVQWVVLYLD